MAVDWRSMFLRYVQTVYDDDPVVGIRCLTTGWCPNWTAEEKIEIEKIWSEINKYE